MSSSARRRLVRDFKRLQADPPAGVTAAPDDANILVWQAVIFGPDDTPWEGGTFRLEMNFSEDYPNKAPAVRFATRVFHPNVYNDGQICLDILQNQWSPTVWKSKFYGAFESSRRPPRHRRGACSMAWRCRFLTARPSQDGRVIAEK